MTAWFVVKTVMRGERDAADALGDAGFETYLPIMRKEMFHRRNRVMVVREFVLFNRYIFAELPLDLRAWAPVWACEDIAGVLGSGGTPQRIPSSDIARFRKAESEGAFDDTREAKIRRREIGRTKRDTTALRFPKGAEVKITAGPFSGFYGQVTSVNGRGAVEAMVRLFSGLTPVEVPVEMVERVGQAA
jgi:transcription antitermination factor NusG